MFGAIDYCRDLIRHGDDSTGSVERQSSSKVLRSPSGCIMRNCEQTTTTEAVLNSSEATSYSDSLIWSPADVGSVKISVAQ